MNKNRIGTSLAVALLVATASVSAATTVPAPQAPGRVRAAVNQGATTVKAAAVNSAAWFKTWVTEAQAFGAILDGFFVGQQRSAVGFKVKDSNGVVKNVAMTLNAEWKGLTASLTGGIGFVAFYGKDVTAELFAQPVSLINGKSLIIAPWKRAAMDDPGRAPLLAAQPANVIRYVPGTGLDPMGFVGMNATRAKNSLIGCFTTLNYHADEAARKQARQTAQYNHNLIRRFINVGGTFTVAQLALNGTPLDARMVIIGGCYGAGVNAALLNRGTLTPLDLNALSASAKAQFNNAYAVAQTELNNAYIVAKTQFNNAYAVVAAKLAGLFAKKAVVAQPVVVVTPETATVVVADTVNPVVAS